MSEALLWNFGLYWCLLVWCSCCGMLCLPLMGSLCSQRFTFTPSVHRALDQLTWGANFRFFLVCSVLAFGRGKTLCLSNGGIISTDLICEQGSRLDIQLDSFEVSQICHHFAFVRDFCWPATSGKIHAVPSFLHLETMALTAVCWSLRASEMALKLFPDWCISITFLHTPSDFFWFWHNVLLVEAF